MSAAAIAMPASYLDRSTSSYLITDDDGEEQPTQDITNLSSNAGGDDDISTNNQSSFDSNEDIAFSNVAELEDVEAFFLANIDNPTEDAEDDALPTFQYTGPIGEGARSIRINRPLPKPTCELTQVTVAPPLPDLNKPTRGKGFMGRRKNNSSKKNKNKVKNFPTTKTVAEWGPFSMTSNGDDDQQASLGWLSYFEVTLLQDPNTNHVRGDSSTASTGSDAEDEVASTVTSSDKPTAPKDDLLDDCISVGISLSSFDATSSMPGWQTGSYGYHGDDGQAFCDQQASPYGPSFGPGDVIGCGIDWQVRRVFYTRNGQFLGHHSALAESPEAGNQPRNWYPTVGLDSHAHVKINVEGPFACDVRAALLSTTSGQDENEIAMPQVVASPEEVESAKSETTSVQVVEQVDVPTMELKEEGNQKKPEESAEKKSTVLPIARNVVVRTKGDETTQERAGEEEPVDPTAEVNVDTQDIVEVVSKEKFDTKECLETMVAAVAAPAEQHEADLVVKSDSKKADASASHETLVQQIREENQAQVDELQSKIESLRKDVKERKSKAKTLQRSVSDLTKQLQGSEKAQEILKQQLEKKQETIELTSVSANELKKSISDLQGQLKKSEMSEYAVKEELNAKISEMEGLQSMTKSLNASVAEIQDELKTKTDVALSLGEQLSERSATLLQEQALVKTLSATIEDLKNQLSRHKEADAVLVHQLAEKDAKIASLEQEVWQLTSDKDLTTEKDAKIASLEQEVNRLTSDKDIIAEKETKIASLELEVNQLTSEKGLIAEKDAKIAALEREVGELSSRCEMIVEKQSQIEEIENAEKSKIVETFQTQVRSLMEQTRKMVDATQAATDAGLERTKKSIGEATVALGQKSLNVVGSARDASNKIASTISANKNSVVAATALSAVAMSMAFVYGRGSRR